MERKNRVVDLSSFLLVEGTADSEADCEFLKLCQDAIMICDYDGDPEDDAESCSCDTSEVLESNDDQDCRDSDEADNKDCHGKQSWCKIWLENEELEYMSTEDGEATSDGTNLSKKIIDQMEDRHFWETCLAVGYP
ncbi:uncharacterized protein LOC8262368 [Ricinus communis]|uniref:Uncharacterized protein n=1 Tax=Ricinus communis TaxID=3988 RepID=B9RSX9_RICCO|nr:uncharacterized protein LOC8262368 [Ricinus communis]EEF45462.1 conserved hypothetical protein [Ricinus communis]|eukprot:XP_015573303.1 uncharacterized protein LOC8262368 [Ricinus communis]